MNSNNPIVQLINIQKEYDDQFSISDFNLDIQNKEFLALLGPSGCGKSTLLRILAGFEDIDSGEVVLRGKTVSSRKKTVPAEKRGIGMVFQDYALFPHLTLYENIAFGLKGSRHETEQRVQEMLNLVGMKGHEHKTPDLISGGQQQRIAVARALAPKPELILLDEPFSNLDYRLRIGLREEIGDILRHEGVSVVLVTHDQTEAFTFAERIIMMKDGRQVQSGSPIDIYKTPLNPWIASFVGDANFFDIEIKNGQTTSLQELLSTTFSQPDGKYRLMVRPEEIEVTNAESVQPNAAISKVHFLGDAQQLLISPDNLPELTAKVAVNEVFQPGQKIRLQFKSHQLFDAN